jgi:hypothetical protein
MHINGTQSPGICYLYYKEITYFLCVIHPTTIGYRQPPTKPTEKNNPRHSRETFPLTTMEHRIGEPDYGCPSFFQVMGGFLLTFLIIIALLSVHALGSWTWYLTPKVARAVYGYIAHCISTLCFVLHKIERILFVYSCSSTIALRFTTGLSLLACRLLMSFVYISTGLIVTVIIVVNAMRAARDLRNAWTERYGKADKTE